MESYRERKPGSVRLNDEQYEEMEELGFENESQYLRYKLNQTPMRVSHRDHVSHDHDYGESHISDRLALQKAQFENQRLKETLQEITSRQQEALNGVNDHVSQLLQEELRKRDFEALKKENAQQVKQIEKLESKLKKAEDQLDDKDFEIAELVKKLGIVELGKALLPGAVSGLAKRYPKELKGLAETLGELGGQLEALPQHTQAMDEDRQQLVAFAEYFQSLFDQEQVEEVMELVGRISEALKSDSTTLQKITYYLNQLAKVRKARTENISTESLEIENAGI